jgi:transcriptional regulator with XRE-family HTH domain
LRKKRGLSLAEVARETGISTSFLSMVENGRSDITTGRLIKLARYYGLSIADLVDGPARPEEMVVRRGAERQVRSATEKIVYRLLAPNSRVMMPFIALFEEGGGETELVRHEGEEFLHVLEGKLALDLNDSESIVLARGDSVYLRSDRPHAYRNVGKGRARVFGVVTPPSF